MTSQKQIEANRRNTQKSTGPKTREGKAAVRLNALRHRLRARTVVLPSENADDFHQLCADLETEFHPQTRAEQILVEEMAVSHSKAGQSKPFALWRRYLACRSPVRQFPSVLVSMKRSFIKAMRELDHLQKTRQPRPGSG
jgi:hypothetical protein